MCESAEIFGDFTSNDSVIVEMPCSVSTSLNDSSSEKVISRSSESNEEMELPDVPHLEKSTDMGDMPNSNSPFTGLTSLVSTSSKQDIPTSSGSNEEMACDQEDRTDLRNQVTSYISSVTLNRREIVSQKRKAENEGISQAWKRRKENDSMSVEVSSVAASVYCSEAEISPAEKISEADATIRAIFGAESATSVSQTTLNLKSENDDYKIFDFIAKGHFGEFQPRKTENEEHSRHRKRRRESSSSSSVEVASSIEFLYVSSKGNAVTKTQKGDEQHFNLVCQSGEYTLVDLLGEGVYGKVVRCRNMKTQEFVAAKLCEIKNFRKEAFIWDKLNKSICHEVPIVHLVDKFELGQHGCFLFELLGKSVQQLIDEEQIPVKGISQILEDLLSALSKLKEIDIIHSDIKPDNVMLSHHHSGQYKVKLIDFGLAIRKETDYFPKVVQSLYYRAPEVLLGLPYNEAIDMWSVGCILGALLMRRHIYPGHSEYEMLRLIHQTHGVPPFDLLNWNVKSSNFFIKELVMDNKTSRLGFKWRLKSPDEYYGDPRLRCRQITKFQLINLDDPVMMNIFDAEEKGNETPLAGDLGDSCTDLLKRMLELDPRKRITPEEALKHRFFQELRCL